MCTCSRWSISTASHWSSAQYTCHHRLCTLSMILLLMDGRKCSYMNWHKAWDKDMKFVNCLNKICTTVPLEGSNEDRMLQACQLKLIPNNDNYPHDAMHVYAWNAHCDEWNAFKLKLLPGREFTNIATDTKKDDCTELANVTVPTNPYETGNMKKSSNCKD